MVNTLLVAISAFTLLAWLVQEKLARQQMRQRFDSCIAQQRALPVEQMTEQLEPSWNRLLVKLLSAMWLGWVASVILLKDGDFALVLVLLTVLAGVVAGLDRFVFSAARRAYVESRAVVDFLAAYAEDQRRALQAFFCLESMVAEYAKSFFPVLFAVLVLRSFIIEPFQIPSASMVPSLLIGDYILVNKYAYGLRLPVLGTKLVEVDQPKRGDVMVFFPPHDERYFIKRVIGLPGDQISYRNRQLFINGEEMTQIVLAELPPINPVVQLASERLGEVDHAVHNSLTLPARDFSTTVPPGHYFMMGDNRDNSSDSRVWGTVPEKNIVGKAFAIWMHWRSFTELPSFSRVGTIQ